ncbi:MAG: hypothetical protein ACREO8_08090 [Luteimonas sp.]
MTADFNPDEPVGTVAAQLAFAIADVAMIDGGGPRLRYRRVGDGFAPERSCMGRLLAIGQGVTVRFLLPAEEEIDFVELVLSARPGRYRIEWIAVDGDRLVDLAARTVHLLGHQLPVSNAETLRVASDMFPPAVEVDLRGIIGADAKHPVPLDVLVVREDALAASVEDARSSLEARSTEIIALLRSQGDATFAQAREQRTHRELLRAQSAGLESILRVLVNTHTAALDTLRAQIDAQAELQRESLADAHRQIASGLQAHSDRQSAETGAIAALQGEISALRQSIDNVFWRRWARLLRGNP